MITEAELRRDLDDWGTPVKAVAVVLKAIFGTPEKRRRPIGNHVETRHVSRKMGGAVVVTHTRTAEFAGSILLERDRNTLAFRCRPSTFDVPHTHPGTGRKSRFQVNPMFFSVETNGVVCADYIADARLDRHKEEQPDRFEYSEEHGWRDKVLEEFFGEQGIQYRLHAHSEIPHQFIRNLDFLGDYYLPTCPAVSEGGAKRIKEAFEECSSLSIAELENDFGISADDIFKSVADQEVLFNLEDDDLADLHTSLVYANLAALELDRMAAQSKAPELVRQDVSIVEETIINYQGQSYRVGIVGDDSVTLHKENSDKVVEFKIRTLEEFFNAGKIKIISTPDSAGAAVSRVALTPNQTEKVIYRRGILKRWERGEENLPVGIRTIQRWRALITSAGDDISAQNVALADVGSAKGNHLPKIPAKLLEEIDTLIKNKFNTPTAPTVKALHAFLQTRCDELDIRNCSLEALQKRVHTKKSNKKRCGNRFAYMHQQIIWRLKRGENIHGVRPFQFVHIDSTPLPIRLRLPGQEMRLSTVHLTLAIDACTRRILGFSLSFQKPSYRSTMLTLRDIVRRWGRVPDVLICDRGPEFRAKALARFCALYGIDLRFRPAHHARAGSVMERVFGTTIHTFINNLEGNTKVLTHTRTMTKSINPERFKGWTLPALHAGLDFWFNQIYGTDRHSTLKQSPNDYFDDRVRATGVRGHRMVRLDETFLIESCPSPEGGETRVVDPVRGIKVAHVWYQCPAFTQASLWKKPLPVRIDPWDARVVYIQANGIWHQATSKLLFTLGRLTIVELQYFLEEENLRSSPQQPMTSERAEKLVRAMNPKNWDPRLSAEIAEDRLVYDMLGLGPVRPIDPAPQVNSANMNSCEPQTTVKPTTIPTDNTDNPDESLLTMEDSFGLI